MGVLGWFFTLASVIGIGGAIAAFYFAPAVAVPVIQSVVSSILRCKPCLYALGVVALCVASFWYGHHKAVADCRAGEAAARLAAQNADIDAAKSAAASAALKIKVIEDQAQERASKDAEYIAKLEANPSCALTDRDIGGLRDKRRWHGIPVPPSLAK